jgi:Cu(I)/Ag(I) efflux system membrane fusion protein
MNKKNTRMAAAAVALVAAAAGYGLYRLGTQHGAAVAAAAGPAAAASAPAMAMTMEPAAPMPAAAAPAPTGKVPQGVPEGEAATRRHIDAGIKAGDMDPVAGRPILYYHDPMVPGNKFDKPAKSPFMDMMLVPVYGEAPTAAAGPNAAAGPSADTGKVSISPRVQQNLGVRTALVTQGLLSPELSAVGNIAFNERDQAIVQARAAGYVARLHVRATLDRVAKGQPLVDLYVPEWIAAPEEFLSVRRMAGSSSNNSLASLVDGARQRMRLAGMGDALISQVESTGRPQARTTITAPVGGVVVELMVREGMTVAAGATLFRINGLATVWANAEVPESQAALLKPGARVVARTPAAPGTAYEGTVQALLPEVNAATRTLKARVELRNTGMQLVPGMFVSMQFTDKRSGAALLIPTEAVIQTGKRSVVMLAEDNGRFRPVQVETGIESAGQTQVLRGLQAGQRVVVSSQFLIDSEASLRGFEARLNDAPAPGAKP